MHLLRNFRVIVVFRLLLLGIVVVSGTLAVLRMENYVVLLIVLGLIAIALIADILRLVNKTNRDVTSFLLGIKYEDFAGNYSAHYRGKSFSNLYEAFNLINEKFRSVRAEKEAGHQYLQTIVEQVQTGLLCLDSQGNVYLMNKALKTMLAKPHLLSLDHLKKVNQELHQVLIELRPKEQKLVKLNVNQQLKQLSVQVAEFKLRNEPFRLFSFQNIQAELEAQELLAWQKLISILRHEIMNSVTPILSLSSTIEDLLDPQYGEPDLETLTDVREAIHAIQQRSEGLVKFTQTYRSLTRVPQPDFRETNLQPLVHQLVTLFKPETEKLGIRVEVDLPALDNELTLDPELIEQVLINLFKNAIHAVQDVEQPRIRITTGRSKDNRPQLSISDNGTGIPAEDIDRIFVPFFTRKQEGTGIGLSLSRQIMLLHQGNISVQSEVGVGTSFLLSF